MDLETTLPVRQADDPEVAEAVTNEVLSVMPDINRQWLSCRTGHDPHLLINVLLDNAERVPKERQNPLDLSITSEDGEMMEIAADNWVHKMVTAGNKDDVVADLVDCFKGIPPAGPLPRRVNYHEWYQIKPYVEQKFPNVKAIRLQKIFSPIHLGNYKKSMIVASLIQMDRFTEQLATELRIPKLWSADWKLKIPRRGRAPPQPACLAEGERAVAEVVEMAIGEPGERLTCAVCYDDRLAKFMMSCGEDEKDDDQHYVCFGCFREQGKALCTDGKLAEGGQGLQCVEPGCERIYPWAKVKKMLDAKTRKTLGRRIDQEALVVLGQELERCKTCCYAMIIEASKDEVRFFECPRCRANFCRTCTGNWKDHGGRSCKEMKEKENVKDAARKQLEEELAAAIVRKCHRCGIQFAKEEGCNKMTCRCGATQCYICRATNIQYNHFCNHVHDPATMGCPHKCGGCILWEKREKVDHAALEAIRQKALADEALRDIVKEIDGKTRTVAH